MEHRGRQSEFVVTFGVDEDQFQAWRCGDDPDQSDARWHTCRPVCGCEARRWQDLGQMGMRRMDMRFRLIIALGVLLTATSAVAHLSCSSESDSNKPITVKGLVTKVEWQNPHAYFYVNVKDDATGVLT